MSPTREANRGAREEYILKTVFWLGISKPNYMHFFIFNSKWHILRWQTNILATFKTPNALKTIRGDTPIQSIARSPSRDSHCVPEGGTKHVPRGGTKHVPNGGTKTYQMKLTKNHKRTCRRQKPVFAKNYEGKRSNPPKLNVGRSAQQ